MVNADRHIVIFNKRLDKASRREVYIPTGLAGVSFYDTRTAAQAVTMMSESFTFSIRVPIDAQATAGRTYIPEADYNLLADEDAMHHWTLHKGDIVLLHNTQFADIDEAGELFEGQSGTEPDIEALLASGIFYRTIIRITEYADNTIRGSRAVKHWRIGGA